MKSDEQKSKQNGDVNKKDKDKTLNSDIPESPSLSPFFWLREEEENEGGTAETLSEPPSLDTPLRHNAPTFSDIKDSDDERPIDMTPNVSYLEHVFLFFPRFFGFLVQLLCLPFGYMCCRAKLRFQKYSTVKSLNGAKDLAPLSCVLPH